MSAHRTGFGLYLSEDLPVRLDGNLDGMTLGRAGLDAFSIARGVVPSGRQSGLAVPEVLESTKRKILYTLYPSIKRSPKMETSQEKDFAVGFQVEISGFFPLQQALSGMAERHRRGSSLEYQPSPLRHRHKPLPPLQRQHLDLQIPQRLLRAPHLRHAQHLLRRQLAVRDEQAATRGARGGAGAGRGCGSRRYRWSSSGRRGAAGWGAF